MKSLGSVLDSIKMGSILKINQMEIKGEKKFVGCIMYYDGEVEKDVKDVELGDFIKIIPNIARELENDDIYELRYNRHTGMYESAILKKMEELYDGCREVPIWGIVDDLISTNKVLYNSIMDLEQKIANKISDHLILCKRKVS